MIGVAHAQKCTYGGESKGVEWGARALSFRVFLTVFGDTEYTHQHSVRDLTLLPAQLTSYAIEGRMVDMVPTDGYVPVPVIQIRWASSAPLVPPSISANPCM